MHFVRIGETVAAYVNGPFPHGGLISVMGRVAGVPGTWDARVTHMLPPVRVLVADDDPDMLRTVADALDRLGTTVVRAESGGELIEKLVDEGPFALVVTDVGMPWMSGIQAMYAVRHAGLETPVIIMTALADARIPEDVQRLGARAVLLRKPFDLAALESTAVDLLSRTS